MQDPQLEQSSNFHWLSGKQGCSPSKLWKACSNFVTKIINHAKLNGSSLWANALLSKFYILWKNQLAFAVKWQAREKLQDFQTIK